MLESLPERLFLYEIIRYGGCNAYFALNVVTRKFHKHVKRLYTLLDPIEVLDLPFNAWKMCESLEYKPPNERIARIVNRARNEGDVFFMDEDEFRKVVVAQLMFSHLRRSRPFPHYVYGKDILLLMLRTLAPSGSGGHPLEKMLLEHVQRELRKDGGLQLEVGDRIANMQLLWRKHVDGSRCSCWSLLLLLYRYRETHSLHEVLQTFIRLV